MNYSISMYNGHILLSKVVVVEEVLYVLRRQAVTQFEEPCKDIDGERLVKLNITHHLLLLSLYLKGLLDLALVFLDAKLFEGLSFNTLLKEVMGRRVIVRIITERHLR